MEPSLSLSQSRGGRFVTKPKTHAALRCATAMAASGEQSDAEEQEQFGAVEGQCRGCGSSLKCSSTKQIRDDDNT